MIPFEENVREAFQKRGILSEEALLSFRCAAITENARCDAYTVVTREGIAVLFAIDTVFSKDKPAYPPSFFGRVLRKGRRLFTSAGREGAPGFTELGYSFVPLDAIASLHCQEQISHIDLIVTAKDGEGGYDRLLFSVSNRYRKETFDFAEKLNDYLTSGTAPDPQIRTERVCPICHTPYADPERKFCKKCFGKEKIVSKLIPFFSKYKKEIVLVVLAVIVRVTLDVLSPYIGSKFFYDEVLASDGRFYGLILPVVGVMLGVALTVALSNMGLAIINAKVSARVTCDLKKTIFSSFERLSYSFFTSRQTGKLMTQINRDAETLYTFFCDGVPYFFVHLIQIIGIFVMMFAINPALAAIIFLPIPVLFFLYYLVMKMLKRMQAENFNDQSRYTSILSDVLNGMRIVKSFSREETEIARFDKASNRFSASLLKIALRRNTVFPLFTLLVRFMYYLVWGFGGYLVIRGAITPGSGITYGTLMLFLSYLGLLYTPMEFFAQFFNNLSRSLNALQRLFEIQETPPEVQEAQNPVTPDTIKGRVQFDRVTFSYLPGKKVIRDVSFEIPAGGNLGIVGHTGAGKSTLANLLTRLYDPDSGSILIDGVDLRDLSLERLHDRVAIVSQETYLFRASILDNIRYASPEASLDEVILAAKAAGCHEFIMAFPDGYDTVVGFDRKELSGGERQRISIARAILKNPDILILDEATSAMDTRTERKIQQALHEISKNRTTISIAHRLSTLRDADSLIVIEKGAVVESGTHEDLLKKKGAYFELFRLQAEALKTIGIEE